MKLPTGTNAERKIENFLEHNVELIEPGLRLVRRQYALRHVVPIGTIDLFCQGDDGAQVCVELKCNLCARAIGQVMAYYSVLSARAEKHDLPEPRIYCIGMTVSNQYREALKIIDGGSQINLTTLFYRPTPMTRLNDDVWEVELIPDNHPSISAD